MFLYSIQLTGIFLLFMVVSMLITRIVARKNRKARQSVRRPIGELTGIVEEFYNGRDVIKAYNHEHASIARVKEASAKNAAASQKADFLTNFVNPLIRLLTRLAHVVIAIIAGYEMINGRMSVGVVQRSSSISTGGRAATEASFMINSLQAALASAERTFEMLDEEEERPDTPYPVILREPKGQISFQHVSFGYQPGRLLMKDISFTPARAEDRHRRQHRRRQDDPGQPAHAIL